jgi:hypothetical protein
MPLSAFPSISPNFSLVRIPAFRTAVISYGGAVEQRIALDPSPRWSLKLKYPSLSKTDADTIVNFFIARLGSFEAFTITDEQGTSHTVRFKEDSINLDYFRHLLYSLGEIEFITVTG